MIDFVLLVFYGGESLSVRVFCLVCGKDGWRSRWVQSDWKKAEGKAGTFKHTAGKWHGDPDDRGLISPLTTSSFCESWCLEKFNMQVISQE